jgi:hypothetical protein
MFVFGKSEPEDGGWICHEEEEVLCRAEVLVTFAAQISGEIRMSNRS